MSLQDTVLMQLRDLILSGQFEPGHRLAEQQLAFNYARHLARGPR